MTRQLLFGKPDWLAVFDRVHGAVPHRLNLHHTSDRIERDGRRLHARGRHGLDLEGFVQYPAPADLVVNQGEIIPLPGSLGKGSDNVHRQSYVRLLNQVDGTYRVLLFAREPGRAVTVRALGSAGMVVETPEYTDVIFLGDTDIEETINDPALGRVNFHGKAGWIRRAAGGVISAVVSDGERISAFGTDLDGRGPWAWNLDGNRSSEITGTPRPLTVGQSPI